MLIELSEIEKTYPARRRGVEVKALNGIDLFIEKGEMVAIKGPSGAGKSTLLHIMGCLDQPTKGTYKLDGVDLSKESLKQLSKIRNKKLGFVMQHFALIDDDSVLDNVGVPLLFAKTHFSAIDPFAHAALQRVGIDNLSEQRASKLSGGEKQRVAIARAMVNDPDVILADEPTGALDTKNSIMIMDIFQALNAQGKTIIIVTHEDLVAQVCHRVITISDGKIVQ